MSDPATKSIPTKVEIVESVLYQRIEDEVVLLDMVGQRYFGLDDVGARMWELLIEDHDVARVASQLEAEFAVEPSVLRNDLYGLVLDLLEAGLLKSVAI